MVVGIMIYKLCTAFHMNGFFLISKKYARNITKDTDNELFIFCCFSFLGSCEAFPEPFDDDEFYDGVVSPLRAYATNARSRRSPEDKFSTIKDAESLIPSNYSIHEPPPTNNSKYNCKEVLMHICMYSMYIYISNLYVHCTCLPSAGSEFFILPYTIAWM